jgi:DNA replication protein DnaC
MAKADNSCIKEMRKIERQQLLFINDFGLQPLDNTARNLLLAIIEDRHGKSSFIITSPFPVNSWYDVFGESTVADAILDRIVHSSHRIELQGESMRKKNKK